MSPTFKIAAVIASTLAAGAGAAHADTLTASFTYDQPVSVRINSGPITGDVHAVNFHWTRTDAPGEGIDATIPREFRSFCIELDQGIRSGRDYPFNVRTMDQAGITADKQLAIQSLWASHFNETTTATGNAAFQLAIWELRYDTEQSVTAGAFSLSGTSAAATLAQSWLADLNTTTLRDLPTLRILDNADAQNQITEIPEPGAIACMLTGLGLLRRRRTR